jgi:hypothetical protein
MHLALSFYLLSGSKALTRASISRLQPPRSFYLRISPEHSFRLPTLAVDFGQELRPIPPSSWRHIQGTRCVPTYSTGTEVVFRDRICLEGA